MNDSHIISIVQIKEFIKVAKSIEFRGVSRKEKYEWIDTALLRFRYFSLQKKEKTVLKKYIQQMTGYSDAQLTRLIAKKKKVGKIIANNRGRHCFPKKYTPADVARLVETDNFHLRLSDPATQEILKREHKRFHRKAYQNISNISSSHIYNLRNTRQYQSHSLTIKRTNPTKAPVEERRKPDPQGRPGFLRVDTVHQGDLDKEKGVYHINITDEVTQWEIVGAIEKISEYYLKPLLEDSIVQFPFKIINFHSDNGSEFINKAVTKLLNKLLIQQTKSRARHCNDNALAEGKNGSIVRKHIGYQHIPQRYAPLINQFYKEYLNVYLNYHRPCGFATIVTDKKGKEKKFYKTYQTPYERFKSLSNVQQYLKRDTTFKRLDEIAYEKSDNEFATLMQKAKDELFENFSRHKLQSPTMFATFISGSYVD
ncbi:DDE-type integrase/transposase/recombinase [Patescibacteria group bacterium]|nr:DDE-type integrase/transposase/recombinase [Patescibacteria group bacterium]